MELIVSGVLLNSAVEIIQGPYAGKSGRISAVFISDVRVKFLINLTNGEFIEVLAANTKTW